MLVATDHSRYRAGRRCQVDEIDRIDWFIIGMSEQLQDTHAQSSGESELYALGAGCTHVADEESKTVCLNNILTALRHPWKWLLVDRNSSQGVRDLDQQRVELAKIREHWERTITRYLELELENCSS